MLDVRGTFSKYREHLTRLTPNPEDALGSPIRGSSELSLAQYWCPRARTGHVPLPSDQVIKVIWVMTPGRSFIPDEHMVWCPEQLLQGVLAHIHYIPDHWQGNAHKSETREEMAQLFQYKAVSGGEQGLVWRQGSLHPGNALSRRGEGREGESTKQLLGTRGMAHECLVRWDLGLPQRLGKPLLPCQGHLQCGLSAAFTHMPPYKHSSL